MPAEERMKSIYITLSFLLLTTVVKAEKLTIYTYDSFVSEWGPGPLIEKQLISLNFYRNILIFYSGVLKC